MAWHAIRHKTTIAMAFHAMTMAINGPRMRCCTASHDAIRRLHARLQEGENEIFVRVIQNRLKLTAVAVRDPAGTLIGYYERYDKAVEPPGAPRTDSPENARS